MTQEKLTTTPETVTTVRPAELTAEQAEQFVLSVIRYIQSHTQLPEARTASINPTADSSVTFQPQTVYPLSAFPHYQEFSDSV